LRVIIESPDEEISIGRNIKSEGNKNVTNHRT